MRTRNKNAARLIAAAARTVAVGIAVVTGCGIATGTAVADGLITPKEKPAPYYCDFTQYYTNPDCNDAYRSAYNTNAEAANAAYAGVTQQLNAATATSNALAAQATQGVVQPTTVGGSVACGNSTVAAPGVDLPVGGDPSILAAQEDAAGDAAGNVLSSAGETPDAPATDPTPCDESGPSYRVGGDCTLSPVRPFGSGSSVIGAARVNCRSYRSASMTVCVQKYIAQDARFDSPGFTSANRCTPITRFTPARNGLSFELDKFARCDATGGRLVRYRTHVTLSVQGDKSAAAAEKFSSSADIPCSAP